MRHPSYALPLSLVALLALAAAPARAQDDSKNPKPPTMSPGGGGGGSKGEAGDVNDTLELKKGGAVIFKKDKKAGALGPKAKKHRYKGYTKDPKSVGQYKAKALERLDPDAAKKLPPAELHKAQEYAIGKEINEDVQDTLSEKIAQAGSAEEKERRSAQLEAAKGAEKRLEGDKAALEKAHGKIFREKMGGGGASGSNAAPAGNH